MSNQSRHDGKMQRKYEVFAVGFGTTYSGSDFDAAWREFEAHAQAGHTVGFSAWGELVALGARGLMERL